MSSMTIKDIPEPLFEQIRDAASRQHRSVNKTFIHLVQLGLQQETPECRYDPAETEIQVRAWQAIAGQWQADMSPDEEIEAIYAARNRGQEVNL